MMPGENGEISGFSLNRLEALSDGVFAIVLTLLVLLIETPEPHPGKSDLLKALGGMVHVFLAYIVSFILIGIYWWRHHTLFHYIEKADSVLIVLNLLFLLWIAFIPFPTDLLMEYLWTPQERIVVVIYGGIHIICGFLLSGIWRYASNRHRLVYKDLSPGIIDNIKKLLMYNALIYLVPICVSFIAAWIALPVLLAVPLFNFLPPVKVVREVNLSQYGK